MNVLLFNGAGFAYPMGLPITTGFKDQIDTLQTDLKLFIQSYLGPNKDDIEKVLSALDELSNRNSLLYHILEKRTQANPASSYQPVYSEISNFISLATTASNNIKRNLYTSLNTFDVLTAVELYQNLLLEIKNTFPDKFSLSIFTTNYDLTFEKFLLNQGDFLKKELGVKRIEFGFNFQYGANIFDPTIKYKWQSDIIEYQKLHGSLDWVSDGELCMKSGASLPPNSPKETPILYPGYKDTPNSEPFISMHHNLSEKLLTADIVIVIGFAFRDAYINSIFESFLRSNPNSISILCYNPLQENSLPPDSRIPYFKKKYHAFKHIEKGISMEKNSLKIDHNR